MKVGSTLNKKKKHLITVRGMVEKFFIEGLNDRQPTGNQWKLL